MPILHTLSPCDQCPFRRGSQFLHPARAAQIARTHLEQGGGAIFHCHKHLNRRKGDRLHCAGALLFALANGIHTQAMQLGARLGIYRLDQLQGKTRVYTTLKEMVSGHSSQPKL